MAEDEKSGAGLYILGALILAGGIVAVIYSGGDDPKPPPPPPPVVTQEPAPMMAAPPPPPKPKPTASAEASASAEPEDAGLQASGTGGKSLGGPSPCTKCGEGVGSGALDSALRGAASTARGCYQRVLQKNQGAEGKMTVVVSVGPSGQVCSVSIGADTVGSGDVKQCVLARFQGNTFPKPEKGCVTRNIPISFSAK